MIVLSFVIGTIHPRGVFDRGPFDVAAERDRADVTFRARQRFRTHYDKTGLEAVGRLACHNAVVSGGNAPAAKRRVSTCFNRKPDPKGGAGLMVRRRDAVRFPLGRQACR